MSCKCARMTDQYHGWECSITDGPCVFFNPDSKRCAEEYGEGPDANEYESLEVDEIFTSKCKVHLYDFEHESKIPDYDENKIGGYKATTCGYQRKRVTTNRKEVTCKLCLKIINEK